MHTSTHKHLLPHPDLYPTPFHLPRVFIERAGPFTNKLLNTSAASPNFGVGNHLCTLRDTPAARLSCGCCQGENNAIELLDVTHHYA